MTRNALSLSFVLAAAPLSAAADPTSIELFGYTFKVQRFDLTSSVTFTDPLTPIQTIGMLECEGVHWLGNSKLLLSSNEMDQWGSYANIVVEANLLQNGAGKVTGLSFSRVVVVNDENVTPAPNDFDLDPGGITINTGATGLGANGQIVVADTNLERLRAYDFTTGQYLGDFGINPPNDELEDVVYRDGKFYCPRENQSPQFAIDVFTVGGTFVTTLAAGADLNPAIQGGPKGLAYVTESSKMPPQLRGHGDLLMLAFADDGPALQFIDLAGNEIDYFWLTSDGTEFGAPVLDPGLQTLTIESCTYDPQTGRIFLVQQGTGQNDNYLWVLSPLEENYGTGCAGTGGFVPSLAAEGELSSGSNFTWSLEGGLGGSNALLMFGLAKAQLTVTPGCFLWTAPIFNMLSLPLSGGGPGQGNIVIPTFVPPGVPSGVDFYLQAFVVDGGVLRGYSCTGGQYLGTP